jgi:hypothetical protein
MARELREVRRLGGTEVASCRVNDADQQELIHSSIKPGLKDDGGYAAASKGAHAGASSPRELEMYRRCSLDYPQADLHRPGNFDE